MKFDAYAAACIPEKCSVLGLKLKALSLGHYLLMRRFNCAYASDEENSISFSDLITGVLICSMTFEDCVAFFDLPKIKFWSWRNIKSLGTAWYLSNKFGPTGYEIRLWGAEFVKQIRNKEDFNIISETRKYQKYINDGSEMPLYYEGDQKSNKPDASHWSVGLHYFLTTKYDESTAMNLPLRQAFMEYCKWAEQQGAIELMQPYEEDMVKGIV